MDKHIITLLHTSPDNQRTIARRRRDKQASGILERPAFRNRQQRRLFGAQLGGKGALRGAKDSGAGRETRRFGAAWGGDYGAGKFGARDPGKCYTRLLVSF